MSDATVWVTLEREGFHYWPKAPQAYAYLRKEHRHLFRLRLATTVSDDDRELSFEDLRGHLARSWPGPALGAQSCEHVARHMADVVSLVIGRTVTVTVSEDGEAGATVTAG